LRFTEYNQEKPTTLEHENPRIKKGRKKAKRKKRKNQKQLTSPHLISSHHYSIIMSMRSLDSSRNHIMITNIITKRILGLAAPRQPAQTIVTLLSKPHMPGSRPRSKFGQDGAVFTKVVQFAAVVTDHFTPAHVAVPV
jgi:hypothetical protein